MLKIIMAKPCYSDIQCQIIKDQIERRAKYRKEFLRLRTDPCKHSQEAGYVFDEALQRFMTMKTYQVYHFTPGVSHVVKGVLTILPMIAYGIALYNDRMKLDQNCRCGIIKYRDRIFKLK